MNTGTRLTVILALFISLSKITSAQRLWEPANGIPVRQGYHIEFNGSVASDDNGNLCVIWSDARAGERGIYAQLYNSDNEATWDEEGTLVAKTPSRFENLAIILIGDNSWFLVWEDFRFDVGDMNVSDLYMQKINSEGEPQWDDGENPALAGIPLVRMQGTQNNFKIVRDGQGGVISAWTDSRNGSWDIFCQRLDENGNSPDGWPSIEDGNMMVAGGDGQQGNSIGNFDLISLGDGGFILGWVYWEQYENPLIFAQKVSMSAGLLWDAVHPDSADAERGLPVGLNADFPQDVRICSDGNDGVFFVWRDSGENRISDLFCQHISSDGTVLWQEDGEDLCDIEGIQFNPRILNNSEGEAIIIWENDRPNPNDFNIRMQKISGDEEVVLNWGEEGAETEGIILCDAPRDQYGITMVFDDAGGAIVSWQSEGNNIFANRINSDGEKIWDNGNGLFIGNTRYYEYNSALLRIGDYVKVIWLKAFATDPDGGPGIYHQLLDYDDGEIMWDENGVEVISGLGYNAFKATPLYDGEYVYIGFEDNRLGALGKYTYLQKLDFATGEEQWEENGMKLTPGYPYNDEDTVAVRMDSVTFTVNDDGEIFSAWHDNRESFFYLVAAQKIDMDGNLLWGDRAALVAPPEGDEGTRDQSRPRLLPADDGGLIVGFQKYTVDLFQNILIQRMNSDGEPQWTENDHNALIVTDMPFDHILEGLTYFDDGSILVVFNQTISPVNYDIFAQRVSMDGELLWDEPVEICAIENDSTMQNRAKLVNVPDGVLIVWEDQRRGSPIKDIYGQIISSDGSLSWDEAGAPLVVADNQQESISLGVRTNNPVSFWLAWRDSRDQTDPDIYAQRFNWDGEPLLEPENGVLVTGSDHEQKRPNVIVGTEQDVYIVWEDDTGDCHVDLKYTHLDSYGEPIDDIYSDDGLILCDAYHEQIKHRLINDHEGGFVVAWEDLRSSQTEFVSNIYAQRVNDGLVGIRNHQNTSSVTEWSLSPAYPNPFNSSTIIRYDVPVSAHVEIQIYNLLGQQIQTLFEGRQVAGSHKVILNNSHLASGLYFAVMQSGNFNKTRKLMLLK
ncbi:MAG: T9SS type A sorting domain-containing protein [Candidatus Electryonea clarkiae]|nr:T9SS type A sorting domain-containing protein [Candidatus Electryonea clarkiae]MDP8285110.1 T9SS type A sorting domain-containing protein [Candidatus Electryonea clarkiae]